MSAVVLPTSMSSASGRASATASAVATQLAAATSHGRARATSTGTSSPAVVSTLSGRSPSASCAASSTNDTPSRLVRNASESSAVIVTATAWAGPPATAAATSRSTAASAARSRQTSNGRETVRSESPSSQAALVFAPPMSIASVAAAAGMRVVPVIDLKAGTAVHAVRGERESYRPVRSVIAGPDGDAPALAHAFRAQLGLDELYVADLDAISGAGDNAAVLGALAREAQLMVDAGVGAAARARALLDLGARRVIVGTETLSGPDALDRMLAELPERTVILGLDLREGRALSLDPELAGRPALDALGRLARAGLHEAIVLDLARVGSGAGPDVALIAAIHAAFPELDLLAGGGVRDVGDLRALDAAGAAGALVATALHRGVIGARELDELR